MVLDFITQYYGIDLLAMILSFVGIYLLGNKNTYGFVIAFSGNVLWLILGVLTQSLGLIFANVILALLYIRGYVRWRRNPENRKIV